MGLLGNGFDDPQSAAIMALAGGLLQGNFGAGLLGANDAYASHKANALKTQMDQARLAEMQAQGQDRTLKMQREQEAMELARRKQSALPRLFGGGLQPAQPGQIGSGSFGAMPVPAGGDMPQRQPGGGQFDVQAALREGFTPKEIMEYAALRNANQDEVARVLTEQGPGGAKIEQQYDKFGRKVGAGVNGYVAPVQVNRGGSVDFVQPAPGVSLPMTMSFSDKNAAAQLGLSRQRLALEQNNAQAGKVPAGYRANPDGTLSFIPGGPADPARNGEKMPSEGERKAATLLKRLEGSQQQLTRALGTNAGAAKPELIPSAIRGAKIPFIGGIPGADAAANTITSQERQRVEAAQLDMLDAALTLGTGAAYTREQLEGYRQSYFPQIGDDAKNVRDKQERLQNVIEAAKIAAGRAGPGRTGGATASFDDNDPLGLRK